MSVLLASFRACLLVFFVCFLILIVIYPWNTMKMIPVTDSSLDRPRPYRPEPRADRPEPRADRPGHRTDRPDPIYQHGGSKTQSPSKHNTRNIHLYKDTTQRTRHRKKNVLLITSDDFRAKFDDTDGIRASKVYTPNLDTLAEGSLVLDQAYCQFSLCGPSRASMMTSRLPDTTQVFRNVDAWRINRGGRQKTTIAHLFKQEGYRVAGLGKLFHGDYPAGAWTEPYFTAAGRQYSSDLLADWASVPADVRDRQPLEDDTVLDKALEYLEDFAPEAITGVQPFFIAVGFHRPHVPFVCPEEFHKMYTLEKADQYLLQKDWQTPWIKPADKVGNISGGNSHVIPDHFLRELRLAYFACATYVDSLIGRLLEALTRLDLKSSTIVAFVSDHGFHLGENRMWSKYTTRERSLRVPMMIHVPGDTDRGIKADTPVELLDLFPTLVQAAGLTPITPCPPDSSNVSLCTEGMSLVPLLSDPGTPVKEVARSQLWRGPRYTEYTIRTARYRYTEVAENVPVAVSDWRVDHKLAWCGNDNQTEFYDYTLDPHEQYNQTLNPKYGSQQEYMRELLHKTFTRAYNIPQ